MQYHRNTNVNKYGVGKNLISIFLNVHFRIFFETETKNAHLRFENLKYFTKSATIASKYGTASSEGTCGSCCVSRLESWSPMNHPFNRVKGTVAYTYLKLWHAEKLARVYPNQLANVTYQTLSHETEEKLLGGAT